MIKNSAGRGFSFRVRMWGTSSPHVKRAGDFGNATEGTRIGDQFPSCVFAKNSEPCNFRLFQQYRHQAAVVECPLYVGFWGWSRLNECIAPTAACDRYCCKSRQAGSVK